MRNIGLKDFYLTTIVISNYVKDYNSKNMENAQNPDFELLILILVIL